MHEKLVDRIQQRFDDLELRMNRRFSHVIVVIRSYTRIIDVFISRSVKISVSFLKSTATIVGEIGLVLLSFGIPIMLSFSLGLEARTWWGILLTIVAVVLAGLLVYIALFGKRGEVADTAHVEEDHPLVTRIAILG